MPVGGKREGAGRKPGPATLAIRQIVNDPACITNALKYAREDATFWLKLYEHMHGRPAQAIFLGGIEGADPLRYQAVFADAENANPHTNGATNGHADPAVAEDISAGLSRGSGT